MKKNKLFVKKYASLMRNYQEHSKLMKIYLLYQNPIYQMS